MKPDHLEQHQSNGSHRGKVDHRVLNEEVLQSAVEAAKDEALVVEASALGHAAQQLRENHQRLGIAGSWYQHMEEQATSYVLLQPMKSSIIAASAGALLALLFEYGLKRLIRPSH
jgi:ElaB/YqjD/DUF883 family membrane-anchored ribosome-binding protein